MCNNNIQIALCCLISNIYIIKKIEFNYNILNLFNLYLEDKEDVNEFTTLNIYNEDNSIVITFLKISQNFLSRIANELILSLRNFFSLFNNPEKDWEYVLAEASEMPPELTLFD